MIHAIGTPGQPVRLYLDSEEEDRAAMQCGTGEVAILVDERLRWAMIAADGSHIIAGSAPDEWEADQVRARRTALLAACDWTQLADADLTDTQRDAWASYRQALRDITETQVGVPLDLIIWPEQP